MDKILELYKTFLDPMKRHKRYSVLSDGSRESIADHSWSVSVLALKLGDFFQWEETDELIKYLLLHDLDEAVIGDIPYNTQKTNPGIVRVRKAANKATLDLLPNSLKTYMRSSNLSKRTKALAKFCDKLDWTLQTITPYEIGSVFETVQMQSHYLDEFFYKSRTLFKDSTAGELEFLDELEEILKNYTKREVANV